MINARADTVAEKPSFRNAFKQRRCLIPADGFYEWKVVGKDKQPYRIMLRDERIFSMAGLWESWTSPEGEEVKSCTIISTEPNELMIEINQDLLMKKHDLLISSTLCTCVFSKYGSSIVNGKVLNKGKSIIRPNVRFVFEDKKVVA